jgi:hypothetical protein
MGGVLFLVSYGCSLRFVAWKNQMRCSYSVYDQYTQEKIQKFLTFLD